MRIWQPMIGEKRDKRVTEQCYCDDPCCREPERVSGTVLFLFAGKRGPGRSIQGRVGCAQPLIIARYCGNMSRQ